MLRESEEYFQIVDMPREKDQLWQQFTLIFSTVGMTYGTLRSRLGVDKARKLSFLFKQLNKYDLEQKLKKKSKKYFPIPVFNIYSYLSRKTTLQTIMIQQKIKKPYCFRKIRIKILKKLIFQTRLIYLKVLRLPLNALLPLVFCF